MMMMIVMMIKLVMTMTMVVKMMRMMRLDFWWFSLQMRAFSGKIPRGYPLQSSHYTTGHA